MDYSINKHKLKVRQSGDCFKEQGKKPTLQIRLQGKWLYDAGLRINDQVEVYISDGQLTLRRIA